MKEKNTGSTRTDDPLAKGRDLSKLKRLGRLGELGRTVSAEALEPRNIKVHISIKLDSDVLEWFKARATEPNSAGYQTLINNALRATMERSHTGSDDERAALLDDDEFLAAVADRVASRLSAR